MRIDLNFVLKEIWCEASEINANNVNEIFCCKLEFWNVCRIAVVGIYKQSHISFLCGDSSNVKMTSIRTLLWLDFTKYLYNGIPIQDFFNNLINISISEWYLIQLAVKCPEFSLVLHGLDMSDCLQFILCMYPCLMVSMVARISLIKILLTCLLP